MYKQPTVWQALFDAIVVIVFQVLNAVFFESVFSFFFLPQRLRSLLLIRILDVCIAFIFDDLGLCQLRHLAERVILVLEQRADTVVHVLCDLLVWKAQPEPSLRRCQHEAVSAATLLNF